MHFAQLVVTVLFVSLHVSQVNGVSDNPVVTTTLGDVRGITTSYARVFRGIPYAEPPVGSLRLTSPEPIRPWRPKVLDATKAGPSCPQNCTFIPDSCPTETAEDCLFLNVFTPKGATLSDNLPVMFWIHGGDFLFSSGTIEGYFGDQFVHDYDIVLVTINYRLGALGFLYDASQEVVGNYGLEDQIMALTWVNKNIAAFGGDPSQVTIFGQSAGGSSVSLLLMDELAVNLFDKAIIESNPWGIPLRTPKTWVQTSDAFIRYAGCRGKPILSCLQNVSLHTILLAQNRTQEDYITQIGDVLDAGLFWAPTCETNFVPRQPIFAFQQGRVRNVPIMIGSVWNEGVLFVNMAFAHRMLKIEYDASLAFLFGAANAKEIENHYPIPSDHDYREPTSLILTDAGFRCPVRNVSASLSKLRNLKPPIFTYRFNHQSSFNPSFWTKNREYCWPKVCHGEELPYVFDSPDANGNFTAGEKELSVLMETYWSNFAKFGNPNGKGKGSPLVWPEFDGTSQSEMIFRTTKDDNGRGSFVTHKEDVAACQLWDELNYEWVK